MSQWGFYFNQDRCLGCLTCKMACKNWNEKRRGDALINTRSYLQDNQEYAAEQNGGEYGVGVGQEENQNIYLDSEGRSNYEEFNKYYMKEDWRRIETYEYGTCTLDKSTNTFVQGVDRRYLTISCNHCSDPVCVKVCPMGNIRKDYATGAVLVVSYESCISCGKCKESCPWDAPQFYDDNFASYRQDDPKRPKMTKCTLCVDRISIGLKPACVAACWNRALDAGPVEELIAKYGEGNITTTLPEFKSSQTPLGDTQPNIFFKKKTDRIRK